MQSILAQLLAGRPLDEAGARRAFELILGGEANESQVGAMLALMASRAPTIDEIVGGARAMRAHVTRVPVPGGGPPVLDTCGTGGAPKTFNISTAAAIVAAAAAPGRLRVAKHGGRSRSGRGSAEVLASLGVNIDAAPAAQSRCLTEAGVCFSFAINHHPAMKFAAGPRKSLGFPTIFNLLGPLANPAGASHQLMGVYDAAFVPLVAEALARLGAARAMVVHGLDGMDEISTTGPTLVARVEAGRVEARRLDASAHGVPRASIADLEAGTLERAAEMIRGVLGGRPGPAREIVALNAGAALEIAGAAASLAEGLELARIAIDSGAAGRTLVLLSRLSHEPA